MKVLPSNKFHKCFTDRLWDSQKALHSWLLLTKQEKALFSFCSACVQSTSSPDFLVYDWCPKVTNSQYRSLQLFLTLVHNRISIRTRWVVYFIYLCYFLKRCKTYNYITKQLTNLGKGSFTTVVFLSSFLAALAASLASFFAAFFDFPCSLLTTDRTIIEHRDIRNAIHAKNKAILPRGFWNVFFNVHFWTFPSTLQWRLVRLKIPLPNLW